MPIISPGFKNPFDEVMKPVSHSPAGILYVKHTQLECYRLEKTDVPSG